MRSKNAFDNAVPAGNGTILEVLSKIHYLTGDRVVYEKATDIIKAFSIELGRNFFPLATFLNNFETLIEGLQILIVGSRDEPATLELLSVLNEFSLPTKVINIVPDTENLPFDHPANGKTRKDDKPTVYICTGRVCSEPANTPMDFRKQLENRAK